MKRVKNFWILICMAVLFCLFISGPQVAHASFVLKGGSPAASFTDLGGQGFGSDPRLLTLQNNGAESGQVVLSSTGVPSAAGFPVPADPNNVANPGPNSDKNSAPSLATLGWSSGANVSIGLNLSETGSTTGDTLTAMVLTVYNGSNAPVGTFPLLGTQSFSLADITLQQGNGNAVFDFILTGPEQTAFNTLISGANLSAWHVALGASFTGTLDGPDSFIAIPGPGAQIPEPATLLLLGSGLVGVVVVARKRIKK